ncbi:MAG: epimerase [Marmoricola sp.]
MRIVIPGGSGQVGGLLRRWFAGDGHDVVVLSRRPEILEPGIRHRVWDARSEGDWIEELEGADVVVNLAGRSVSCRYTDTHLREMMSSRVDSTLAVGRALESVDQPPATWLQMSTATIYAHRRDEPNDERTGIIGGDEPDVPLYWEYSVRIAKRWEEAQNRADLPSTRRVALRTAMVMSPDRGGVFDYLLGMARLGLGGPVAGGSQYVSWIHAVDFCRAVDLLVRRSDIDGPVNLAAPGPLPQRDLMRDLRRAWGHRPGLPATRAMAELGAWALRTDTELLLKSRRVVPGRLREAGFDFVHPTWSGAAADLVAQVRADRRAA